MELKCPELTELRLCLEGQKGTCAALKKIALKSNAIRSICWRAFPALETLILDCPSLRSCDLSECDALQSSFLKTFAQPGQSGCPRLQ